MKNLKYILTTLLISGIISITSACSSNTDNLNQTIETTTSSQTKSIDDVITSDIKPNTLFQYGDFYYYLKADGTLAKNEEIDYRQFDSLGRYLDVDDFKPVFKTIVNALQYGHAELPVADSQLADLSDFNTLLKMFSVRYGATWVEFNTQLKNETIIIETKNYRNTNYSIKEQLKAIEYIESLNLKTFDEILEYTKNFKTDTNDISNLENTDLHDLLLGDQKSVCQGYAQFIYWACKYANIPTRLITIRIEDALGELETTNHVLNQVYIDNQWKYYDTILTTPSLNLLGFDSLTQYETNSDGEKNGFKLVPLDDKIDYVIY